MKILHTADLHIRSKGDPRWKTLELLIDIAKNEDVNIMVICGDLFDTEVAAENIRVELRDIFSGNPFHTLIIPGNHDVDAYSAGYYFGDKVTVFSSKNIQDNKYIEGNACFMGLPYQELDSVSVANLLLNLSNWLPQDCINIILYHGELLDTFYSREDFGSEGESRYMPTRLSFFRDLPINYVLAGHFHSNFDVYEIANEKYFVYPGSPISITKRELGQRCINLFELGDHPRKFPIDTHHFKQIRITLYPDGDSDPLRIVEEKLGQAHPEANVLLTIDGYIRLEETQFSNNIKALCKDKPVEIDNRVKDFRKIISDPLYELFIQKLLEEIQDEDEIGEIKQLVIKAMIEAQL